MPKNTHRPTPLYTQETSVRGERDKGAHVINFVL